jgi:hypothetical protein
MGKIYVGQTDLTIRIKTNRDLTNAVLVEIAYQKPDCTQGSFVATIENAQCGIIKYQVALITDIDQKGNWKFWAKITFMLGSIGIGEPANLTVYKPGT